MVNYENGQNCRKLLKWDGSVSKNNTVPRYYDRSVTLCTRLEYDISKNFGRALISDNYAVPFVCPKFKMAAIRYSRVGHIFFILRINAPFVFLTLSRRL